MRLTLRLAIGFAVVVVSALIVGVAAKPRGVASPTSAVRVSPVSSNVKMESRGIDSRPLSEQAVSSDNEQGPSNETPEEAPIRDVGSPEKAAQEKPRTESDLIEYLRLGNVPYSRIEEDLGQESLPILYRILTDRQYLRDWPRAATAIAYLGENQRSYRAILDYIRRYDSWEGLPGKEGAFLCLAKTGAIWLLSLVGGQEGERILQTMLRDPAYVEDLLADWIKYPNFAETIGPHNHFIMEARGAAARGLVLTRKETSIELVREAHVAALENSRKADEQLSKIPAPTDEDIGAATYEDQLYNRMVNALAIDRYIKSHSVASYLDSANSEHLQRELRQLRYQIRGEDGNI